MKPWGTLIFRGLPVVDKSTKQLLVPAEKSGTRRCCYREAARGFCHAESLALCSREVPLSWQGGQQPAGVTQGVECEEVGTSFGISRCLGSEGWFLEGDVIFLLVLLIWGMLGETQSGVIEEAAGAARSRVEGLEGEGLAVDGNKAILSTGTGDGQSGHRCQHGDRCGRWMVRRILCGFFLFSP